MRLRRLLVVLTLYLAGAFLVDLSLRALIPVLVLPPLFLRLGRAFLALGLLISLAAAWSYGSQEG